MGHVPVATGGRHQVLPAPGEEAVVGEGDRRDLYCLAGLRGHREQRQPVRFDGSRVVEVRPKQNPLAVGGPLGHHRRRDLVPGTPVDDPHRPGGQVVHPDLLGPRNSRLWGVPVGDIAAGGIQRPGGIDPDGQAARPPVHGRLDQAPSGSLADQGVLAWQPLPGGGIRVVEASPAQRGAHAAPGCRDHKALAERNPPAVGAERHRPGHARHRGVLGPGFLEVSGHAAGAAGQSVMIWLQVRDVHAEHQRLAAAGVRILRKPRAEPWGLTEMWIEDPDGVRIVVVQVPADHPLRRDSRSSPPAA
ncbi:MAG TPA: VOC family protein [Streptosporangiaceae bacterium]